MSSSSSKKTSGNCPEFAVRRETISAYFSPPLASSTFYDLVNKGRITDLLAWDKDIRSPSPSTRKRLKKAIGEARACLKPVPVSSLFTSTTTIHDDNS